MTRAGKIYCSSVIAAGVVITTLTAAHGLRSFSVARLIAYLLIAATLATIKLRIPGLTATVSGGSVLIFASLTELTSGEGVMIAITVGLAQCLWKPVYRLKLVQVVFSVSTLAISVTIARYLGHCLTNWLAPDNAVMMLASATPVYFVANTVLLAGILSLTEMKPVYQVWNKLYLWMFPHYLLSAALGGLFGYMSRGANWPVLFILLPGAYLALGYARVLVRQHETSSDPGMNPMTRGTGRD